MSNIEKLPSESDSATEESNVIPFSKSAEKLIGDERLKEKMDFALEAIKDHPQWKSKVVDGFWNKLTKEDRFMLYKGGKPSLFNIIKKGSVLLTLMPNLKYDDLRLKMFGDKIAESARSMIQLDLLPAPEGISDEELSEDILDDQKALERALGFAQILVTFFAPEAATKVAEAKQVLKAIVETKTTMAKNQQEKRIKKAA